MAPLKPNGNLLGSEVTSLVLLHRYTILNVLDDVFIVYQHPVFGENENNILAVGPTTTNVNFNVISCSSIHTHLYNDMNHQSLLYDFRIGTNGNQKSAIYRGGKNGVEKQTVMTPGILACDHHKQFYLTWRVGGIL